MSISKTRRISNPIVEPSDLIPPNHDYIELTICKISATYLTASGKNSTLTMERMDANTFRVIEGDTGRRWNNKSKKRVYSMDQWDTYYADLIKSGWICFSTERREKKTVTSNIEMMNGKEYAPIPDKDAEKIVRRLIGYANQMIQENYQKKITDVPDWAFEEAKRELDALAMECGDISNHEFNERLLHIFAVLPRRIDVLSKYIAAKDATAEDRAKIIEEERDRYDVLHSMLRGGTCKDLTGKETILEAYGIELRKFTDEESAHARKLLGEQSRRFINGWRVINHRTEKAFSSFCRREHLSEGTGVDFLFHGSRSENWWSILSNGLTINPVGVVITGKAYGQGTYFAPDAIKSLGYTSVTGAAWTSGGQSTGFMAIYKVATGNRYDGHLGTDPTLNWDRLQKIQPGAHCTWAECRYSGFRMDEVIVYKNEQSTIWGLMELSM